MPLCEFTKATATVLTEWDYIFSFKQRQLLHRLNLSGDACGVHTFYEHTGTPLKEPLVHKIDNCSG